MGIVLGPNQYGKAENRVVRVYRDTARHEIRDLNVSTSLRGDFAAAHSPATSPPCCPPTPRRTPRSPSPRSTASPRPRTTPSPSAAASSRRRRRRPTRGCRSRSTPGTGSVAPDHAFVRRGGEIRTTVVDVSARRTRGVRPPGPGRAEVDRVGVQGLPGRRVHHSRRGRRPHPRHVARAVAVRRGPTDWNAAYAPSGS